MTRYWAYLETIFNRNGWMAALATLVVVVALLVAISLLTGISLLDVVQFVINLG